MKIRIENYKNISSLDYEIVDEKINVLFGLCGSGKSAIANAVEGIDLEFNKKIDALSNPLISINSKDFSDYRISVFNEHSLGKYVFDEENTNKNIFSVIVDDEMAYQKNRKELEDRIKEIEDALIFTQKRFNDLKSIQSNLGATYNKSGQIRSSSPLNKILKSLESIKRRKVLKEIENIGGEKFAWINSGFSSFYNKDSRECPFCEKVMGKGKIAKMYDYSQFEQKWIKSISLSTNEQSILGLSSNPITGNAIKEIIKKLKLIFESLNDHENISKQISDFFDVNIDEDKIKPFVIGKHFFEIFPEFKNPITHFNHRIKTFKDIIKNTKAKTKDLLSRKTNMVNDFLRIFDVPYLVRASYKRGVIDSYKIILEGDKTENDRRHSLSQGERIILSLLLFILDEAKKDCDLIVIDDPASSFDSTKRGMIFGYIAKFLYGKTILILSHDSVFVKYALQNIKDDRCQSHCN